MSARSRGSITGITLAVLIALAAQSLQPALAQQEYGDDLNGYLAVRANAPTCIDQSAPVVKRVASCTVIIKLADHGSSTARTNIEAIYVARAEAFQEEGNDQAALQDFATAATRSPRSELPWIGLGNFRMAKSEYSRALESFDHAVKVGSKDPLVYDDRGAAFVALKRNDEALADFARAITLDPRDTAALSNRATLYLASGRAHLALADLSAVISIEPANANALYNRGVAYERTEALDKAAEDFRSAVRVQPSFAQAYEALGSVLAKKSPQEALAQLSEAIRLDPHSPAVVSRAILYLSLGRFEPAVRDLDQAIADDRSDEIAYIDRGVAEEALGHLAMALEDYSRSIHIETTAAALVDRGSIYLRLGQPQNALADFDAALALEPDDLAALTGRADANYSPDERDPERLAGSLSDFSRVIAASPKNAAAYSVRGNIHFDLKQYAAAYSDLSESLELDSDQPAVLFNRALAAEHLGRSAEAARDRQAARKLDASARTDAGAARKAAGSPTQIEYAAPKDIAQEEQPRVAFAAPRAAPQATPASPSGPAVPIPEVTINGYRPVMVNGQERFCETETALGSHVEKSTVCYSQYELKAERENAQRYIRGVQGQSGIVMGGSCQHSAANSCL
ncbi:MAG: tetratricopeptide repeat protein [Steroidobacteraceae bacterium]